MDTRLREDTAAFIETQQGAVARTQAGTPSGLSAEAMRGKLRYGRWQRPYRGVYLAFTGEAQREAALWSALLRAGPGATLSHQTAAERHGLIDEPSALIHITVPVNRHPARRTRISDVVIHRSTHLASTRHPAMSPPCTTIEDTVLDLVQSAATFGDALGWLSKAVGRRKTTAVRLLGAMARRKKVRWRARIVAALDDIGEGTLSLLEHKYASDVERAHGLPAAQRQARIRQGGGNRYLDNLYPEWRVCVELDGAAAHPADQQWRDKRRDNWNLAHEGIVTLRFGLLDLEEDRCQTAYEVALVLQARGWHGRLTPCPACPRSMITGHNGPRRPEKTRDH